MPDIRQVHIPGHPLHLIQRGWLRAACFFCERDRAAYLHWLTRYAAQTGCAVHAYVLMANHVHLLLTPAHADGVARLMGGLAGRHARYIGEAHEREGTLWDERVETVPVHVRQYLLACMRYIELNPVRAGLVTRPQAYRWSSFGANALGIEDALITPHAHYCALGRSAEARQAAYRAMFVQRVAGAARHPR